MKAIFVKLQCITNLHVGNGDVNYNIIDNEVERDPVTNLPTINSSGVKGALRQYFANVNLETVMNESKYDFKGKNKNFVMEWFGNDVKAKTKAEKDQEQGAKQDNTSDNQPDGEKSQNDHNTEGKLKILPAELIAQPLRASKGPRAFYLATSDAALSRYREIKYIFLKSIAKEKDFSDRNSSQINVNDDKDKVELEGIAVGETCMIAGEMAYLLKDNDFKKISLPVMARNKLENGISKNLWYEEVVPHDSIFVFPVVAHDCDVELLKDFKKAIEGKLIQFGGNASIGEGLCLVTTAGEV